MRRGSLLSGLRRRRTKMNKGFLKKEGDLEGTFWRRIENQLSLIRRKGRHTEELPKTFYWTIVLQMSFCCKKNMFWRFLCHGNPLRHQNRKSDPLRHHSLYLSLRARSADHKIHWIPVQRTIQWICCRTAFFDPVDFKMCSERAIPPSIVSLELPKITVFTYKLINW